MNPPPIPPQPEEKKSLFRQAATLSLVAPGIFILVNGLAYAIIAGSGSDKTKASIVPAISTLLIVAGVVFSIIGLAGMSREGTRDILWRSMAGLIINGFIIIVFTFGVVQGFIKAHQRNERATREIQSAVEDFHASVKSSFNPKTGITNFDLSKMDRLENRMTNAMSDLTGDDSKISKSMGDFFDRMRIAMQNYQTAVQHLRESRVLGPITNKNDFVGRREIVRQFLDANDQLTGVLTNAENDFRRDLTQKGVSPAKIDEVLAGYRHGAQSKMPMTIQIRELDDTRGKTTLDALDVLESEWGHWEYNSENKIVFQNSSARATYKSDLDTITSIVDKQLRLQKLLVNLQ